MKAAKFGAGGCDAQKEGKRGKGGDDKRTRSPREEQKDFEIKEVGKSVLRMEGRAG